MYLSNSTELVGLIRDLKLLKYYPWLQDVAADSGKITQSMMPVPPNVVPEVAKGSRREKVLEVVNEYVEGKYRS